MFLTQPKFVVPSSTMNKYEISGDLGFSQAEFEFVSQYTQEKKTFLSWDVDNFDAYVNYITQIREQIKAYNVASHSAHFESSHLGIVRREVHAKLFQYSYQRFDLAVLGDNWLHSIYNISDNRYHSHGLFVKSGMSAFLASLLTLKRLYPTFKNIYLSKEGYFETNDMVNHYLGGFKVDYYHDDVLKIKNPDIVIIDSSSTIPPKDIWFKAKVIIVDTTCWEPNSVFLIELLENLKNYEGLVLLIRSHIKLDCFGLEVNRLGSIVIFGTDNAENFRDECHETTCNIGCNFNIDDCYPWLFDKKFHELCNIRTQQIKYFTNKIYNKIISEDVSNFSIVKGPHDLFIKAKFIRQPKSEFKKLKLGHPMQRYARHVCAAAQKNKLPLVLGTSFGLCYTALDGHGNRTGTETYLRLAPSPNMSENQANKIADFFVDWFSR